MTQMLKCLENLKGNGDRPIPIELLMRLRINIFCSRLLTPDAPKLQFNENLDELVSVESLSSCTSVRAFDDLDFAD